MSKSIKVVVIIAGGFLLLTTFCCTSGLILSLFVDDETMQAMRDRQEARRMAQQDAEAASDNDDSKPVSPLAEITVDAPKAPQPPQFVMPDYTVLDKLKRLDGITQVEVMVASYGQDTLPDFKAKAAKQVAKLEKADTVLLFTTKAAQKAVYSDSFKEANPDAINGYLGRWTEDGFEKAGD